MAAPIFNCNPPKDPSYSPYRAGWDGYTANLTYNPHPNKSTDGALWELGWMDARRAGTRIADRSDTRPKLGGRPL